MLQGDLVLVIRYPHKEKVIDIIWIFKVTAKVLTRYNN